MLRKRLIMPLCQCGCGRRVSKFGNRFIHGHSTMDQRQQTVKAWKGKKFSVEQLQRYHEALKVQKHSMPLCQCGCGQRVSKLRNRFVLGHHSRITLKGNRLSDESKQRISKTRKRRAWMSPGYKHGDSRTYYYNWWNGAKSRCCNVNDAAYVNYGGRGISLHLAWKNDFVAARDWILNNLGPRPGPEYSIDRYPDNNGNYEPGNIRWATWVMQVNNRRKEV